MVVKPGFELGLANLVRHLPLSGHSDFVLQLHGIPSVLVVGYISLLLRLLMMHAMFGMQL